jgi:CheY-like chemotaxis protein
MPDADGYDLIREVRRLPTERGGATPAIAVTAHTRADVRDRVLAAGYEKLEPKPVDLDRLCRALIALAAGESSSVRGSERPVAAG